MSDWVRKILLTFSETASSGRSEIRQGKKSKDDIGQLSTFHRSLEQLEANGRSDLRRRKYGLAVPNGSGAWPRWPEGRTGGEQVCQQGGERGGEGGKDRHGQS